MKIWDFQNLTTLLEQQYYNVSICQAIIADFLKVPEKAILWVEEGKGFFVDSDYGRYNTNKIIIYRVVSEFLVIHIGLETMEHRCFLLSDPDYATKAHKYLKEKKIKWIPRII